MLWSENKSSKYGPSLKMNEFLSLLLTCNLIDTSCETLCSNSFFKAQLDPAVAWELNELGLFIHFFTFYQTIKSFLFVLNTIVFVEFVEALAQVALTVVDTPGFSDAQKVLVGFNMVTDLQHTHK